MSWSRLDSVEKLSSQTVQKDVRGKAREKSTSAGVLVQYVGAIERNEAYEAFFFNSLLNLTFLFSVLLLITVRKELVLVLK